MKLPGRVLNTWRAYFSIEPWPEERAELLNAMLCQSIHRSFAGEDLPLDNWLPKFDMTIEQRIKAEQEASLAAWDAFFEEEE
jgi:hypothetical protein